MRLAELKDGEEYGVLERPQGTFARKNPRHVRVLGRVVVEASRYGAYATSSTTIKKTLITIEFVDDPLPGASRYDKIASAKKGVKLNIEARQFVGLWSALEPIILKKRADEIERTRYQDEINNRLVALLGSAAPPASVRMYDGRPGASVHLIDGALLSLLDLAEKGQSLS